MKRLLYILSLLLLPMMAGAQDRLMPIQFFGGVSDHYATYVMDTIIGHGGCTFAYISRPSFKPEYGLTYDKHTKTLTYSQVECECMNIWYCLAGGRKDYSLARWSVSIPQELGDSLDMLMRVAIATAVIPVDDEMMTGVDGTDYQFIAHFYSAECWSPRRGNNAEMVNLMDSICQLVKNNHADQLVGMMPQISRLTVAYRAKIPYLPVSD